MKLTAPRDFGGVHDIYAVVDGVQVAKGGFLVARNATISPKRGPIGTMITVTYNGLGSSLYEGGASLLYDNHYVGAMMANWTRGTAVAHIRASGPVGSHLIEVADAISFKYLNIQQSPIPWGTGEKFKFNVTADNGRPKAQLDWPENVAPTLDAKTTLQLTGLAPRRRRARQLSTSAGTVNSKVDVTASGLTANAPVDMEWSTVVGNRVNCTGTCWSFVSVPLGNATATSTGSLAEQDHGSGRTGRLARRAADPERPDQGPGPVLRQAERLRQGRLLADAEGRPAVHRPSQGPRLDAARQHDRGRLRQQLRRLRLRLQHATATRS